MRRSVLPSACLAAGALLCLAASAPAAPAPASSDLDKYLPDDAQMVAVVNVKQITAWTPFQKQFQDQIQQALKNGPPAELLKDTGFDPLRDLDRIVIVSAASSPQIIKPPMTAPPGSPVPPPGVKPPGTVEQPPSSIPPPPGVAAPPPPPPPPTPPTVTQTSTGRSPVGFPTFFLIQGKFDADKLEAKAQQAAKDHPAVLKSRKIGGIELWEIIPAGPGPLGDHLYLALLDKDTLMAAGLESQALEALDKANGKKKTEIKDKQVRDGLAKADAKAALQVVCGGDMVTQVSMKSDGKGGFTTTTMSLREDGIEGFRVTVTLGDADIHAELTLTAKDADKAKEMSTYMNAVLEMEVKGVTAAAQQMKDLQPLVDALKTVKITASGDSISVEGSATPDAVQAGVKGLFLPLNTSGGSGAPPTAKPIPIPPPPDLPKKDK